MFILDAVFLGNSVRQRGLAAAFGLGAWVVLRFVLRIVRVRATVLAARTATHWDDIVVRAFDSTKAPFIPVLAAGAASSALNLPPRARGTIHVVLVLALLFQGGIWISAGLTTWLGRYIERGLKSDRSAATTMGAVGFLLRMALWSLIFLLALDNLGVNVTTLVAGLGVGGVAVALAVQNILGDLFASLSIVLDKPFVLGDFVIVDDFLGSVEHIGLKTTRVRSLSGEQLIFSNSDLLRSRLRNYGRMAERRVLFEVGVTYRTPRHLLERIPDIIRAAIAEHRLTRFDRSHFKGYGEFALKFESVYYVLSPEYNLFMDIQQAVNFRIHEQFEAEGIEFAIPAQMLYLERRAAERGAA